MRDAPSKRAYGNISIAVVCHMGQLRRPRPYTQTGVVEFTVVKCQIFAGVPSSASRALLLLPTYRQATTYLADDTGERSTSPTDRNENY